jgi:hypothetical protein
MLRLMRSAVGVEPHVWVNGESTFLTLEMANWLNMKFAVRHTQTFSPVTKKDAEVMIGLACADNGVECYQPQSATNPGWDLWIAGERVSVKTEGSQSISMSGVHISKMMELNGIKGLKSKRAALEFMPRILANLDSYDRLLLLRAFQLQDKKGVIYELVEVPKSIFKPLWDITENDFTAPKKPSGQTSVNIRDEDGLLQYTLRFDASVEKITLTNLRTDLCFIHGVWHLPAISFGVLRPPDGFVYGPRD